MVFMWLSNQLLESIFKLEQLPRCKNRILPPILRSKRRFLTGNILSKIQKSIDRQERVCSDATVRSVMVMMGIETVNVTNRLARRARPDWDNVRLVYAKSPSATSKCIKL